MNKLQQKTVLHLAILIGASCFNIAAARPLGKEGGGGSQLESAFRLKSTQLIEMIAKDPALNALCSADELRRGLNNSKVNFVEEIKDQASLDAWSMPGLIELKTHSWKLHLSGRSPSENAVDALILHELYRTTENCDDDKGSISTAVMTKFAAAKSSAKCNRFGQTLYARFPAKTLFYDIVKAKGGGCKASKPLGIYNESGSFEVNGANWVSCEDGDLYLAGQYKDRNWYVKKADLILTCHDRFEGVPQI